MSEERDDEILGRALARAIETLDPNETPYERSRLAVRPLRRGLPLWQTLGVAAALVLAVAFGAWFTRPSEAPPAAASATPTPAVTASPAVTGGPQVAVPQYEPVWVYFTRDGLPPVGAIVNAHVGVPVTTAEQRIGERLSALAFDTKRADLPGGTTNPLSQAGTYAGGSSLGIGGRVTGDLATVQLDAPNGWGIRDPYTKQLVQQIVYTATEEPGIRRVQLTGRGGGPLKIDQLVFDKILTRDDVSGYSTRAEIGTTTFPGDDKAAHIGADLVSRDIVDGTLVRLTFEGRDRNGAGTAKASLPTMTLSFRANDGSFPHSRVDGPPPPYVLEVGFQWNGGGTSGGVGIIERVDRSPLRVIEGDRNTMYSIGLDDARPWRAYMPDAQHLVVEVGGDPRAVSDRIAVAAPVATTTIDSRISRTVSFTGSARTFEANVVWRLKDSSGKQVATGHTTASVGTSALWGTFGTQITLPAAVTGNVTLEVYEVSPKDGTEQGLVAIPLIVR